MANRYWVGGTGNWDASTTTNWSASSGGLGGASVPTSSDAVIFDANSNATAYTVTVTATASCSDISFTNPASGALTFAGSSVLNVYGNFTILSTITYTHSGTLYIYNQSAGTTKTISTNNVNIKSQIYFGGVATGTRQLLSNIGYSSTVNMNLDGGILDLNGYTLDVSIGNQGTLFQIQSSYTRTIIFGSGTLKCGGFDANGTNLTITAGTGTILLTGSTATFLGNGKTYNIVSFIGHTSYSSSLSITGNNTFGTLTLAPTYAAKDTSVTLSGNQIVSGTFTLSGNSAINRILIKSNTLGTARTITAATVAVTNADFMDITGDGAATWDMSGISGGSGNCGGNSMKALGNAAFTAATNQTWSGTSGGFWSMNGWTTHIPLPQDTALFNVAFGTSKTVTVDMPRVGSIDMTGATWTTALTLSWGTTIASYGSLTLISGLTMGGANLIELGGRGSYVIDTKTVTISRPITLLAPMGTYTLLSDLNIDANILTVTNGTLSTGTFNLSMASIATGAGGTLTLGSGIHSITGTGGGFPINFNPGYTLNAGTSTLKFTNTSNTAITCGFVGKVYYNVWFERGASTGNITIQGNNTFNDFKDTGTVAKSILFTAGSTQTVTTFTVVGTSGNVKTINSNNTSTHSLIKSGGGIVSSDYLNIQHCVATPASTWYAGANSVNNQATATAGSGWVFTVPPGVTNTSAGFFMM